MYVPLAYYVGDTPAPVKVATFLRERGGLKGLADTLTTAQQWQNLTDGWNWINAHPLPDDVDTSSDLYQARQLVIAALVDAQNKLQGGDPVVANAAYTSAMQQYQTFAAQQNAKESPSALATWLSGVGLDIANPLVKAGMVAAAVLAVAVVAPLVMRRAAR